MKKLVTVSLLFVMLVLALATGVQAATSATLADELYAKGQAYGMTASDKVKVERYLSENPVTDDEANAIIAKADEAVAVMTNAGATNYDDLTTEQKNELKSIATSAADIIDVKLVFKTGSVEIYDNTGKLIETVTENNGKLAYTGNNINVVLVVSIIAIIALAITVVAKRTIANAK